MKKCAAILLAVIMLLSLCTACAQPAAESAPAAAPAPAEAPAAPTEAGAAAEASNSTSDMEITAPNGKYKVAYVGTSNVDECNRYVGEVLQGLTDGTDIEFVSYDPNGDVQKQINMMEDAIASNCNAIILMPTDKKAVVEVVKDAHDAGIYVLTISGDLDAESLEYRDFFCGPNDLEAGQKAAEMIMGQFPDGATGVEIMGTAGEDATARRENGFDDAIAGSNITLLDKQNCANWDPSKAMSVIEDAITKYGDEIQFIYSQWDIGSQSIVKALENAGMENVYVVSADGNRTGFELVNDGKIACTMMQNVKRQTMTCLDTAIRLLNGETIEETIVYDPWTVITKENATFDPGW